MRSGVHTRVATAEDERILNERRQYGDGSFDVFAVPGAKTDDLHQRRFKDEYLPRLVDRESLQRHDRSFEERLASAKMIASVDDERLTILGLLALGIRPRHFIPGAYVQFLRVAGRELSDPIIDAAEIDGTVSEILSGVDDKLRSHNRRRVDLVSGAVEQCAEIYPIGALQQLVQNAVMHRDYDATNAPVRVTWFVDRIEIQNPGGPFGAVTAESFARPGVIDYRNPNLAEAMKVLGYGERFGEGIPIARRLLREAGHPDIEFTVAPTHVFATVKAEAGRDEGSP